MRDSDNFRSLPGALYEGALEKMPWQCFLARLYALFLSLILSGCGGADVRGSEPGSSASFSPDQRPQNHGLRVQWL